QAIPGGDQGVGSGTRGPRLQLPIANSSRAQYRPARTVDSRQHTGPVSRAQRPDRVEPPCYDLPQGGHMEITLRRVGSGFTGLALLAGLAAFAASGSSPASAASTKLTKVAIATPAKTSDYGWNSQGVAGLQAAAK